MLQTLSLFQNQFNGSFPAEIGNLSSLEVLELAYNRKFLPSPIPENFTRLKKLKEFWMVGSNLIGEIPERIGDMAPLEVLDLSVNNLEGEIPSSLFTLQNLTILYLYQNKLSGEIPRVVEALNLEVMDLSLNNLAGTIPDEFGKLTKLTGLSLFSNQLSGEIPTSIARIPSLKDVKLFTNNLSGQIPADFGLYSKLEGFEVASNRLTGKLPENLCAGGALLGVVAFDNNLTGELPESLGDCSSLVIIRVHGNGFSGKIPVGLWSSMNLSYLMISDNSFTGELPEKMAWNLSLLDISSNKFSGKIPAGISTWRNLVEFDASNNLFTGAIPQELTVLPFLTTLSLDRNQLSGHLPSAITSWKLLTSLNLSRNHLSGQIPVQLGFLSGLNYLDLSENQFSGQIPPEFGLLKLGTLNLSSNQLTGRIPSEFENSAYDSSFLNNPGLCASNSHLGLSVCNAKTKESSKDNNKFLAVIISIAGIVFILALLFAAFVFRVYRRKKHGFDSTWKLTAFRRLNFTESNILTKLTESNAIGSGGSGKVYRVPVNCSGDVAVKKIWSNKKLDHKLEMEFLAEVQILGTIRHSNIVKLLCCISNESSKLLVYEYLENRSLDRWLHKKTRPVSASGLVHHVALDWPKRLQIAVGAAQGLCYMHHDCLPPIIHQDVKSSNILLDSDFNAKIADFGLAKMLIAQEGEANTMSAVAGSFGYIAPEYAYSTRVSEKVDVYSFGVVLLELATGREANDGDEHTSLAEWAWHHIQDDIPIVNALDKGINEPRYLDEMTNVFKLGIICIGTLPSTRPCMRDVLQFLLRCSHPESYGVKNAPSEYDAAPLLRS